MVSEKILMRFSLFTAAILLFSTQAWGQIDPSSALLLNSGAYSSKREGGIDTGRYTVRPHEATTTKSAPRARAAAEDDDDESDAPAPRATPTPAPTPTPSPTPTPAPASTVAADAEAPNRFELKDDRRLTMLEIALAPGYLYKSSDSAYSPRRYVSASPSLAADAKVWLSPTFALRTAYLGSLGGNVSDSTDGSRNVAATHQWFWVGIRSRKFFGVTRLAPTLEFGVNYFEYDFRVPSDTRMHDRLHSSGVHLSLDAEVPSGPFRSWTLGFEFSPKVQHKETATASDYQSGGSVDANTIGVSMGSKIRFDHSSAMFWKVCYSIEKDVFGSTASLADPQSGVTPSGVSVTNAYTFLQLGYNWGD